ncbi:MAG: DNA methylase [Acidimicrobiaceae bacterium]|nr:DNA methylase [Acidimicrobiaceae bacterium]MYE98369.1 DNA methylase [Acidimicrobiaceae bacterium]MYI54686.1 DNA methylase [Acidimicrobiaceae bacterium]
MSGSPPSNRHLPLGSLDTPDPSRDARVKAAREELRQRLPDMRQLPGCPQGSDDDILAMSYPPYYTACPNPFIADWLAGLDRPSDDDRADPGPFATDVVEGKGNAFYKAHSYPTKVPHPAIMRFILHYTRPGDVVLDGFAGSGMTGVAAQACGNPDPKVRRAIEAELGDDNIEWGPRRAILGELGPSATFIAAGVNLPVDGDDFDRASQHLLERFDREYGWMYRTTITPENGEPFEVGIDYVVWSEVFTCPHCGGEIVFYDVAFDPETGRVDDEFYCSSCGAALTKRQREIRKTKARTLAGDTIDRVDMRPVLIVWRSGGATGSKRVDESDVEVLERVSGMKVPPFPSAPLPNMHMTHERTNLPRWGISSLHHFWPDRPLAALAVLWSWAAEESDLLTRLALQFWIEQAFWGLSWMNRYTPTHYSVLNQYLTGVYYVPSLTAECSIRYNLQGSSPTRGKRKSLVKLWNSSPASAGEVMISTGSSTDLPVPDACVDYVFVDPPFGENIYYADLALVIESWHGNTTSPSEEAIKSRHKASPKSLDLYAELMRRCFAEFFRVLKPGRWMTVEFSNHSNDVWLRIQDALASAGFVVADTRVFDKDQLSYRQITADNAVKHDLVISAYKPAEAAEHSFGVAAGTEDAAWVFVREHLSRVPVTEGRRGRAMVVRERQADRVYERMVAYHVARNTLVPMTAAEFYAGLEQRFPVRDGMYFLPEQAEEYERFRITFKEFAAQTLFIRDESSAVQWLRQLLKDRPRSFADIQPEFMREMQSGVASWEELPELRDMLEANFVDDGSGRWMVPDPKKSEHLDQLRTRALLREFDAYAASRGPLKKFRSEAVRAGFRAAWADRDFDTIVAVGRRLPPDAFVEDSALLHYYRNAERLEE